MSKEIKKEEVLEQPGTVVGVEEQPVVEGEVPGEPVTVKPRSVYRITLLTSYENTIQHSLDTPEITQAAAAHGYSVEKLQEGSAIFQEALDAHQEQQKAYAAQKNATELFTQLRADTVVLRMKIVKTLRLAYEGDKKMLTALGITGKSSNDFPRWVDETRFILEEINERPEVVQTLGNYSITPELIAEGQQALVDTIAADRAQEEAKARAQQATLVKEATFLKIKEWITDYRRVMKTALKGEPRLLEKLVIHAS